MKTHPGITLSIWLVGIMSFGTSEAFTFEPTDAEWNSWAPHCKAQYVLWTNVGRESKFVNSISEFDKAERTKWETDGMAGMHHYCAGTLYLNRAMLAPGERERDYNLRQALAETLYTFRGSNKNSPYYSQLATQMARILYEQEKYDEALSILTDTVSLQPKNPVLYSAIAVMQRKLGHLEEARQTLVKGNEILEGQSAEIHYNLGLISIELGEIDAAVEHAESAYALGYPLQGLRAKLENLGRM